MSVVVLTDGDGSGVSIQGAVLRPSPNFDADADATVAGAFETAYGRELSDSAAVGYDVGQFLDVLIAETDGELPDAAALDRASAKAQARLSFTTIDGLGEPPATSAEPPPLTSGNGDRFSIGSTALLGLGAAAVGAVAIWLGRLRRGKPA